MSTITRANARPSTVIVLATLAAVLVLDTLDVSPSRAQSTDARDRAPGGPPPTPPPEAFEACRGLTEGATCTVTLGGRDISGTCVQSGEELFCRPAGPPPPPPEAFTACEGHVEGDACSVSLRGESRSGTCTTGPDGRLSCRPEGEPPPMR